MNDIKRTLRQASLAALVLAGGAGALSAGGPGSAGMQVLKTDMSPRAAGMGGAFTAVADDIYAINYNPAGLGQLYVPEVSAMHLSGLDDSSLQYAAVGMPLPFLGLAGLEKPGAGFSFMKSGAGTFDYNYIVPGGIRAGEVVTTSYEAQSDWALAFGYGEKVYSGEMDIEGYNAKIEQYLGMNVKYINSTLVRDYSASCFAFDAGWLLLEPKLGISLGASMANYGGGLKYGSEVTKLPGILRLAASYQRPTVMDQSVLLAAEADFYTVEALKSLRLGLEYHFEKIFNLRLGYKGAEDNKGMTMGLGVHYQDLAIDFAMGMGNEVYNASQVAVTYKFSGIAIKEYRKKIKYRDPVPERAAPARGKRPAARERKPARPSPEKKKDSDFFMLY
ncbi:MAG TPA: hypothetical protein DCS63_10665 [Elusimicrobia bacterium]|nr:hypothetical protein [Elusimicrobiota bacterium]